MLRPHPNRLQNLVSSLVVVDRQPHEIDADEKELEDQFYYAVGEMVEHRNAWEELRDNLKTLKMIAS